jgi:predicted DNA-binding transcriptional regulator AlpA
LLLLPEKIQSAPLPLVCWYAKSTFVEFRATTPMLGQAAQSDPPIDWSPSMKEEKRSTIPEDGHLLDSQPNGPLYTVSQVSVILQLPETWIYERTRKHAIPHRKLGKYVRFTDSDLSAIIQMCSRGPETGSSIGIKEQLNA